MVSLPVFFWFAVAGFVGAGSRILLQVYRDDGYQGTWARAGSLLCLGVIAGWLAWLVDPGYLASVSFGFMAPDVIEAFYGKFAPEG